MYVDMLLEAARVVHRMAGTPEMRRAYELLEERNRVMRDWTNPFRFLVQGSRNTPYVVEFTKKGWRCSCPHFAYRKRPCKHVCAVCVTLVAPREP